MSRSAPLLAALQGTVDTLSEMRTVLEQYDSPQSQGTLNRRINDLMDRLQRVDEARGAVAGSEVPAAVLECVPGFVDREEGSNPEAFTRDHLEALVQANAAQQGRDAALQALQEELGGMLDEWDPSS